MPLTRIPDLAYQIDGDSIYIEQDGPSGAEKVELHRMHLAHLAREMGLLDAGIEYPQKRALLRLRSKLELLTDDCFLGEIVERCGEGLTYQACAFDARNILLDLLEDFGLDVQQEPAEDPKRGIPSTGQTMTGAGRQASHCAKQADLLEATQIAVDTDGIGPDGAPNLNAAIGD